jgi:Holliday junction resolvase
MNSDLLVKKANGDLVPFFPEKLEISLQRAGAGDDAIEEIIKRVTAQLYNGISTKEIYKTAFAFLRKKSRPLAAKYKLKKAIQELGPTGFPFERFFGELLKVQGYEVEVDMIIPGKCVSHEVDVLASNNGKRLLVECKFRNSPTAKCDVQVPLYVHSRFRDIRKVWQNNLPDFERELEGWVVTNVRFTKDAIQYGNCANLHLVGWDYPKEGSLKQRIDHSGLHPITCLTTLSKKDKQALLDLGLVLCRNLIDQPDALVEAGIDKRKRSAVLKEATALCSLH